MEKTVHILIGGIGTGKSTFASELSRKESIKSISGDEIQDANSHLSDDEIDVLTNDAVVSCIENEKSFVVDGKHLNPRNRHGIISKCKKEGYRVLGYNFGEGDVTSLLRRKNQPRNISGEEWEETHEKDSEFYSEPDPTEGFDRIFYPPFNL